MRDPDTGVSKGFAFVNYASFDASDSAIDSMEGQYLCNRQISVSYAFKKETKGERHGTWEGQPKPFVYLMCVCFMSVVVLFQSVIWPSRILYSRQTSLTNSLLMLHPKLLPGVSPI